MTDSDYTEAPRTNPLAGSAPPKPPKKTARALADPDPGKAEIDLPDPVSVKDLAAALRQRPFKIVAEVMELGQFKNIHDTVAFDTASKIARRYGFDARRSV